MSVNSGLADQFPIKPSKQVDHSYVLSIRRLLDGFNSLSPEHRKSSSSIIDSLGEKSINLTVYKLKCAKTKTTKYNSVIKLDKRKFVIGATGLDKEQSRVNVGGRLIRFLKDLNRVIDNFKKVFKEKKSILQNFRDFEQNCKSSYFCASETKYGEQINFKIEIATFVKFAARDSVQLNAKMEAIRQMEQFLRQMTMESVNERIETFKNNPKQESNSTSMNNNNPAVQAIFLTDPMIRLINDVNRNVLDKLSCFCNKKWLKTKIQTKPVKNLETGERLFETAVKIQFESNNECFIGTGKSKKDSKRVAAEECFKFLMISCANPNSSIAKSTFEEPTSSTQNSTVKDSNLNINEVELTDFDKTLIRSYQSVASPNISIMDTFNLLIKKFPDIFKVRNISFENGIQTFEITLENGATFDSVMTSKNKTLKPLNEIIAGKLVHYLKIKCRKLNKLGNENKCHKFEFGNATLIENFDNESNENSKLIKMNSENDQQDNCVNTSIESHSSPQIPLILDPANEISDLQKQESKQQTKFEKRIQLMKVFYQVYASNKSGIEIVNEMIKSSKNSIVVSNEYRINQSAALSCIATVIIDGICNFIGSASNETESQKIALEKVFGLLNKVKNIIKIFKSINTGKKLLSEIIETILTKLEDNKSFRIFQEYSENKQLYRTSIEIINFVIFHEIHKDKENSKLLAHQELVKFLKMLTQSLVSCGHQIEEINNDFTSENIYVYDNDNTNQNQELNNKNTLPVDIKPDLSSLNENCHEDSSIDQIDFEKELIESILKVYMKGMSRVEILRYLSYLFPSLVKLKKTIYSEHNCMVEVTFGNGQVFSQISENEEQAIKKLAKKSLKGIMKKMRKSILDSKRNQDNQGNKNVENEIVNENPTDILKISVLLKTFLLVYSKENSDLENFNILKINLATTGISMTISSNKNKRKSEYSSLIIIESLAMFTSIGQTKEDSVLKVISKIFESLKNIVFVLAEFQKIYSSEETSLKIIEILIQRNQETIRYFQDSNNPNYYYASIFISNFVVFSEKGKTQESCHKLVCDKVVQYLSVLSYNVDKMELDYENFQNIEARTVINDLNDENVAETTAELIEPYAKSNTETCDEQTAKPIENPIDEIDIKLNTESCDEQTAKPIEEPIYEFDCKTINETSDEQTAKPVEYAIEQMTYKIINQTIFEKFSKLYDNSDIQLSTVSDLSECQLRKTNKLIKLLDMYNSLPLGSKVNVQKIVDYLKETDDLIGQIEENQTCDASGKAKHYASIEIVDLFTLKCSTFKKRNSLKTIGFEMIRYFTDLNELIRQYKYVYNTALSAVENLNILKSKLKPNYLEIFDTKFKVLIEIENVFSIVSVWKGANIPMDVAASKFIKILEVLSQDSRNFTNESSFTPERVFELAELIKHFDSVCSPEKSQIEIINEMKELGANIVQFTNQIVNLEKVIQKEMYYSVLLFENLTYFHEYGSIKDENDNKIYLNGFNFLRGLTNLVYQFKSEYSQLNSVLDVIDSVVSVHPEIVKIFYSNHSKTREAITTIEIVNLVSFSQKHESILISKYGASMKFVDFLKRLNVQLDFLLIESERVNQTERFFELLVKRFNTVYNIDSLNQLEIMEKMKTKGVYIETFITEHIDSKSQEKTFSCELQIGRQNQLQFIASSKRKIDSKKEAAYMFANYLKMIYMRNVLDDLSVFKRDSTNSQIDTQKKSTLDSKCVDLDYQVQETLYCDENFTDNDFIESDDSDKLNLPKENYENLISIRSEYAANDDKSQISAIDKRAMLIEDLKSINMKNSSIKIMSEIIRNSRNVITISTSLTNEKTNSNAHGIYSTLIKIEKLSVFMACGQSKEASIENASLKIIKYFLNLLKFIHDFENGLLNNSLNCYQLIEFLVSKNPEIIKMKPSLRKNGGFISTVDIVNLTTLSRESKSEIESKLSVCESIVDYLKNVSRIKQREHISSNANTKLESLKSSKQMNQRIYEAVVNQWKSLPKSESQFKMIAAFVITSDRDEDDIRVLSIGTGTKCIQREAMISNRAGEVLLDSHAEVVARRALVCLLYDHLEVLARNGGQDRPELVLELVPDQKGFRLKSHLKLHLYINSPPCGDARIFQFHEFCNKNNDKRRQILRVKWENVKENIPLPDGYFPSWDAIQSGEQRVAFKTCSDKIAMWNVVGVQGALLSAFIEPIYIHSLIVSDLFHRDNITRALYGRIDESKFKLKLNNANRFKINRHLIDCYKPDKVDPDFEATLPKTIPISHNWFRPLGGNQLVPIEIVNSRNGTTHKSEFSLSRLSKRSLLRRYQQLVKCFSKQFLSISSHSPNSVSNEQNLIINDLSPYYRGLKYQSTDYLMAKRALVDTFKDSGFGNWIASPIHVDLFPI